MGHRRLIGSDRPLRVLIVGPDLPIVGGQTVQAHALIRNFQGDREVTANFQPINPIFLPKLQRVKFVRTAVTSLKFLIDLLRKVPQNDIVHIFSASYFSFLLSPTPALLIAKLCRKRTILNYRSGEADDHLTRWKTAVPTVRLFDRVITPSNYLVDVFGKHGLEARAIANVVDTSRFEFRVRRPLAPVFLSNRNLEPLYDVETTIRAFATIQSALPEAKLIVAGEGSERNRLTRLAEDLTSGSVEFLGTVDLKEMPAVYDKADIYLNSPKLDNMPNSIIEAFACGLPVVSTNAGGIPYIVEHERNGLLVPIGDWKAMAESAMRLLSDQDLARKLADQGLSDCSKYDWKNVRAKWVNLYRDLSADPRIEYSEGRIEAATEN